MTTTRSTLKKIARLSNSWGSLQSTSHSVMK
jgi:hypothetical protein